MPRVVDYSPPWLARPSPGADLFSLSNDDQKKSSNSGARPEASASTTGYLLQPRRTLARRDADIFVVVDNQIRWANLTDIKDAWKKKVKQTREESISPQGEHGNDFHGRIRECEDLASSSSNRDESPVGSQLSHYRILLTPVFGQIQQLIISPNGDYLAILTSHTAHIAVVPDSSHLSGPDFSPIRLKTFQLGPTTHVIPESPIVSALWHPLGVNDNYGGCIITVTADAAVRVWEIDRRHQWSFDRPALAIDLKKLVDGTSTEDDFAPLGFGQSKGFSVDAIDMEVASAKFGGYGYEDEDPWAAMTLWIAMRPGDIYALCPLLPSKWQASSITVPLLTSSIVQKLSEAEHSAETEDEVKAVRQQYDWLKEIDNQEPVPTDHSNPYFTEIRSRPARPSPIPRLQGPFIFELGEMDDLDATDIFVIASKPDIDDLLAYEEEREILDESIKDGLSGTIICLATAEGTVHVSLEMDGVEGQWLPRTSKNTFSTPVSEPSDLLYLESLETIRNKDKEHGMWPVFSEDIGSRYNFYLTTSRNVTSFSLSAWVQRVEPELQSLDTAGSSFRMGILCDGLITQREQLMVVSPSDLAPNGETNHLAACLAIFNYDLGYLLLTCSHSQPYAVLMDSPDFGDYSTSQDQTPYEPEPSDQSAVFPVPKRSAYQPPSVLYTPSPLASFLADNVPHGHKHTLKDPVRLSPSTLDTLTIAHRTLSVHTNALERAASDLFRRCERLQMEMRGQLYQLVEVGERINDVSNGTVRGTVRRAPQGREQALDSRMAAAESRQKELVNRYNDIRLKILKAGGRPISEKEKGWIREVDMVSQSVGGDEGKTKGEFTERLQTALDLSRRLLAEVKHTTDSSDEIPSTPDRRSSQHPRVPQRLQKAKIADAMNMVERE
ncbi:hypothetical protein FQN57_005000 [Myotisia sp. PD_48]|nr:hypothetical protein FQN57_005000 [Myotisia sp. PD_48]